MYKLESIVNIFFCLVLLFLILFLDKMGKRKETTIICCLIDLFLYILVYKIRKKKNEKKIENLIFSFFLDQKKKTKNIIPELKKIF